jgi:hypothetical protein
MNTYLILCAIISLFPLFYGGYKLLSKNTPNIQGTQGIQDTQGETSIDDTTKLINLINETEEKFEGIKEKYKIKIKCKELNFSLFLDYFAGGRSILDNLGKVKQQSYLSDIITRNKDFLKNESFEAFEILFQGGLISFEEVIKDIPNFSTFIDYLKSPNGPSLDRMVSEIQIQSNYDDKTIKDIILGKNEIPLEDIEEIKIQIENTIEKYQKEQMNEHEPSMWWVLYDCINNKPQPAADTDGGKSKTKKTRKTRKTRKHRKTKKHKKTRKTKKPRKTKKK